MLLADAHGSTGVSTLATGSSQGGTALRIPGVSPGWAPQAGLEDLWQGFPEAVSPEDRNNFVSKLRNRGL